MKNIFKNIYEFYKYNFPVSLIVTFIIISFLCIPYYIITGEDKLATYHEDRAMALEGCLKCKFTDYNNYYFYTCEGKEFALNRSTWINLNISECK